MNLAVTFGVTKGVYTLITDPNTPHRDQRRNFRKLRRELHGKFDEVQLWTSSGGRVKRQRTTADASPVTPVEDTSAADLLNLDTPAAEPTEAAAETQVSDTSGVAPVASPAPDKRQAALAKARAAAAAKRAAKAPKS